MYVVPSRFDPDYPTLKETLDFDVQNVRALPAPAGSALVWSGRTLHFGGRADKDSQWPRISFSFAASTPAFEDPKMRYSISDRSHDIVIKIQPQDLAKVQEKQKESEREKEKETDGKGKEKDKEQQQQHQTQRNVEAHTVTLPGLRVRLGLIATQLWAYEYRIPISRHLKEVLRSLEV